MSGDGSKLLLISGYNFDDEDQALSSVQLLSTEGPKKEVFYPSLSRLAAAVTLETGAVVVTGGLGSENQVWIKPSTSDVTWSRGKDMFEGRKGHAAGIAKLDEIEVVVVAGGWGILDQELNSVELYRQDQDQWTSRPSMCKPRVDFALKVGIQGL